jgi:hypothetical protein
MRVRGMCSRLWAMDPIDCVDYEPMRRLVCVPTNIPARTRNGSAPDALLLRHWNSQTSDRVEMQPGVRKKSL